MELKRYINNLLIRTIISLLLFFILATILKRDDYYYKLYNIIFNTSIDYSYLKSKSNYLLGKYILNKESFVSSNTLLYKDLKYQNNINYLTVDHNYIINNICDGVVVNKNHSSLIVECDTMITIKYDNIENINVNLYDYLTKDVILGNTVNDQLVLTIKHGSNYLNYEDYI